MKYIVEIRSVETVYISVKASSEEEAKASARELCEQYDEDWSRFDGLIDSDFDRFVEVVEEVAA